MIARDFLALPATSVSSEFAFSKAGCTLRKHRAHLGDDAIQAILESQSFTNLLDIRRAEAEAVKLKSKLGQ
jgi:hypothetical protein